MLEGDWSKREDVFDDEHEEKVHIPASTKEQKDKGPNLLLTNEELQQELERQTKVNNLTSQQQKKNLKKKLKKQQKRNRKKLKQGKITEEQLKNQQQQTIDE